MRRTVACVGLCVLLLAAVVPAQAAIDEPLIALLDPQVEAFMSAHHVPGLGLTVVVDGQTVVRKGYGVAAFGAHPAPDVPVTARTPFEVGSVTKEFTAFAVLLLRDHPRWITKPGMRTLNLDRPVSAYLSPRHGFSIPPAWEQVTVRQLLSMTSGIADASSNTEPYWQILTTAANTKLSNDEYLWFPPGAGYCYADPNFMILGMLIEQMSGWRYGRFMRARIFQPLGMDETLVHGQHNTPADLAAPLRWNGADFEPIAPRSPLSSFSSGAIITTARDMGRWYEGIAAQELLSTSSYEEMWTPVSPFVSPTDSRWALGWEAFSSPQATIYAKDGGLPGYSAFTEYYASEGILVSVVTNASALPDGPPPLEALIREVVATTLGAPIDSVVAIPGTPSTPPCPAST